MSECPNGGASANNGYASNSTPTNGAAAVAAASSHSKLNGGACANAPRTNGHTHTQHHNNYHKSSASSCLSSSACTTHSNTHTTGHQTKITSFYKKSMSEEASSSSSAISQLRQNGSGHSQRVSSSMHHALMSAHETRSCDNQDTTATATSTATTSSSTNGTPAATTTVVVTNSTGGEGSPLRSQLGLNLKSHAPAAAIASKPSPLQCPMCPYTSDSSNVLEEHINRSHFDPLSPSMNRGADGIDAPLSGTAEQTGTNGVSQYPATATANGHSHQNGQQSHAMADTLTALACPICGRAFEQSANLELHVNIEHRDILSPAASKHSATTTTSTATATLTTHAGDANGGAGNGTTPTMSTTPNGCPVCNISLARMSTQQMEVHIEAHFPRSPQPQSAGGELAANGGATNGGATNGAGAVGGAAGVDRPADDLEKQAQKLREQREFEMLRAQYGMDDQGNFREQSATGMQRAVYAGEMSVADYYERQVGLRAAESHGIDDGTSCTRSVAPRVASLSATSPNVLRSSVCSAVDHYASSYGDKGWGCGYRNLQMVLSSLLQVRVMTSSGGGGAYGRRGVNRECLIACRIRHTMRRCTRPGVIRDRRVQPCRAYRDCRKWWRPPGRKDSMFRWVERRVAYAIILYLLIDMNRIHRKFDVVLLWGGDVIRCEITGFEFLDWIYFRMCSLG